MERLQNSATYGIVILNRTPNPIQSSDTVHQHGRANTQVSKQHINQTYHNPRSTLIDHRRAYTPMEESDHGLSNLVHEMLVHMGCSNSVRAQRLMCQVIWQRKGSHDDIWVANMGGLARLQLRGPPSTRRSAAITMCTPKANTI